MVALRTLRHRNMASITIKNIPDRLLTRLREQAAMEQRSMNKEVIRLLDIGLSAERARPADRAHPMEYRRRLAAAQVAAWSRLAGRWISDLPVEDQVGAIYAARSGGREVEM